MNDRRRARCRSLRCHADRVFGKIGGSCTGSCLPDRCDAPFRRPMDETGPRRCCRNRALPADVRPASERMVTRRDAPRESGRAGGIARAVQLARQRRYVASTRSQEGGESADVPSGLPPHGFLPSSSRPLEAAGHAGLPQRSR